MKLTRYVLLGGAVLSSAVLLLPTLLLAAEAESDQASNSETIEEVVVIGRYKSAATDVVSERMESDVPVDMLDAESISRTGDSNVAAALRRIPGLTLVQDKFVYVRGLGERYSSTQVNSAAVPSPDLTRNVVPLDLFPTDIVDALTVSKAYSPDLPAAFGGGNIDIRTKRIPEDRVLSISIKSGFNSQADERGFSYHGGDDDRWGDDDGTRALSDQLSQAIQTYQGDFSAGNIVRLLNRDGDTHTIAEAEAIRRELGTALNRDVDLRSKDVPEDLGIQGSTGYRWYLGPDWEAGVLILGAYDDQWRNKNRINRRLSNPDTDFADTSRTVRTTAITASVNAGVSYMGEHEMGGMALFVRSTDDEASLSTTCAQGQFNDCADGSSPSQGRIAQTRFEQRELELGQLSGKHELGAETLAKLPDALGWLSRVQGATYEWYWSEARALTDIPNETRAESLDNLDPARGQILDSRIRSTLTAIKYSFAELEDKVDSNGFAITVPFTGDGWDLSVSGGYDYVQKTRDFSQLTFGLGSTDASFGSIASGLPSQVFSDANIMNPDNGIALSLNIGQFGEESYAAVQVTDATWGKLDLLLNETWRISAGVRYEDFLQVSVPIDYLAFNSPRISLTPQEIADGLIAVDEYYPSLGVTYILPGFWADEFQLRFAWSETVARPDIREITESIYIDPLTEARVQGRASLRPSDITNFDVRAEWLWSSGDSFTISGFYKEIDQPIETVQGGASEDNILFTFVNAEQGEIYGLEVEWLKSMHMLVEGFYFAGNMTFSDSNIDLDRARAGAASITNDSRRVTQHSEWVANLQLGWDSDDAKHAGTLVYNAFGERIFFAGIDGNDDAFEQPFHSLDLVYSWYPTETITVKAKVQNLLDQSLEIEQRGPAGYVTVIEQDVGMSFAVEVKWDM